MNLDKNFMVAITKIIICETFQLLLLFILLIILVYAIHMRVWPLTCLIVFLLLNVIASYHFINVALGSLISSIIGVIGCLCISLFKIVLYLHCIVGHFNA